MNTRDLWLRLRALMIPNRVEHELDEELAFHIERQTQKHLDAGLTPFEARRRAHAEFGSSAFVEDACRDASGIAFLDSLRGLRGLRGFVMGNEVPEFLIPNFEL